MKKVVEHLKELQGERTQKEFATLLEIPLNTYTNWLLYQRRPTIDALISICTKLGVSADWLLGLTDERAPRSGSVSDALQRKCHDLEVENAALQKALSIVGGHRVHPVKTGGSSATKTA